MTQQQYGPPARAIDPGPPASNGYATAGMVLGIIAAAASVIPFLSLLALPVALVGGSLSGVGFAKSRHPGVPGRGAAIAGIACNVAALLLWGAWLLVWGAAFAEAGA